MNAIASTRELALMLGDKHLFRQLNLHVPAAGCTVLLGPSGTGKSTLLRLMCGQMQKHPLLQLSGHLEVAGLDEAGQPTGTPPALVSQKAELLMSSVWESLVGEWSLRGQLSQLQQKAELARLLTDWGQQDLVSMYGDTLIALSKAQRNRVAIVRKALSDAPLLLIDEPTADIHDESADSIVGLIRMLSQRMPVLVVTHNLRHARALADHVIVLASGRVQEQGPASQFFEAPLSEAGRQFLLTGSCAEDPVQAEELSDVELIAHAPFGAEPSIALQAESAQAAQAQQVALEEKPSTQTPDLVTGAMAPHTSNVLPVLLRRPGGVRSRGPRGFTWIQDDQLAGTPYPGILSDVNDDLGALRDAGITHLISLTEQPFPAALAAPFGIGCSALPMPDMGVPNEEEGVELCRQMDALRTQGHVIAVHCRAGLGRTGTVLAMYRLWQLRGAEPASRAIAWIRSRNSGMIQSLLQEQFLEQFQRLVLDLRSLAPNQPR